MKIMILIIAYAIIALYATNAVKTVYEFKDNGFTIELAGRVAGIAVPPLGILIGAFDALNFTIEHNKKAKFQCLEFTANGRMVEVE